jgi:biopolymer transport protein ExbB
VNAILSTMTHLFAQVQPPAGGAAPAESAVNSVFDLAIKGGPVMIPIALISIVAMAIVVERVVSTRRHRVIPPDFLAGLKSVAADRRRALESCKANGSPIANILGAFLKGQGEPQALLEKHVDEAGQREVARLRLRMRIMGSLPQVSTMLGLLGTVFGMIRTFQSIAASGQALGKTELLAAGIYEAWTATAAGLIVAIPCLLAYYMLMTRLDRVVADIDKATQDWIEEYTTAAPAQPAAVHIEPAPRIHTNSTAHIPAPTAAV